MEGKKGGGLLPKVAFGVSQVALEVKNLPVNFRRPKTRLDQKIPWRRKWQPTPAFLPGKSHGQRSLPGYKSMGLQTVGHG